MVNRGIFCEKFYLGVYMLWKHLFPLVNYSSLFV